jgi:hypothetical protein
MRKLFKVTIGAFFLALAPLSARAVVIPFPTTLQTALPSSNAGTSVSLLQHQITYPVGRSTTSPSDNNIFGIVVDQNGNLHVTLANGVTAFSTSISMSITGSGPSLLTPGWPGIVASNATTSSSIYSQTCAVGNSGGATIVCDPNAYEVEVKFALGRAVVSTTQFALAAFGGTEIAMVLPTGALEYTLAVGGAISTTGVMYDGTVSGRATKGEGMLIRSSYTYTESNLAYSETGTTRYVVSAGPEILNAQGAVKVEAVVCVSDVSMAQAARGQGQILRWGQSYRLPASSPRARTLYACILNAWVPSIPSVTLSISQN